MDSQIMEDREGKFGDGLAGSRQDVEALEQELRRLAAEIAAARQTLAALNDAIIAAEARCAQVAESTLAGRQRRDSIAVEVIALCAERADLLEQVSALRIAAIELEREPVPIISPLPSLPVMTVPVEPVPLPSTLPAAPATASPPAPPSPVAAAAENDDEPHGVLMTPAGRGAMQWVARAQTTVKPRNDTFGDGSHAISRRNEDRLRLEQTASGLLAAVADGAGASGLYCGAWAETLVDRLPEVPIREIGALNDWLDSFCLEFRATILAQCKGDPTKHSKFVREGSCATLVGCWLSANQDGATVHWLGHGDSPFLVFDRTGPEPVLVLSHPERLAVFDRDPHLLNWKTVADPDRLATGTLTLPARATLVLASDGIGQYVLLRHLAAVAAANSGALGAEFAALSLGKESRLAGQAKAHAATPAASATEALTTLWHSLASEDRFAAMVAARCQDGLLANDDSSVIMIDIEPAAPAALRSES